MLGDKNATPPLPPMSPTAIAAAFTGAFKSSDPGTGGCPDVKPLDRHVLHAVVDFAGLELLPLGKTRGMGQGEAGDGK
jgi:hypothetical protein